MLKVENLLPYCHHHHRLSDIALRYLLITLGPIIHISSPHTALHITSHYTLHIASTMLVGGASYYCLCFQLGVIICYAVSPSAVSSLFINNITHPGPHKQRQLPVMMRGWWKSSKHVTSSMCYCVTWGLNNMTYVSWLKFYREIWKMIMTQNLLPDCIHQTCQSGSTRERSRFCTTPESFCQDISPH